MAKRKSIAWVVIHCEYMPRGLDPDSGLMPVTDEMVFHVAGSLRAAEKYVKAVMVNSHSWWKIERRVVDEPDPDADDQPARYFYNHRGQRRAKEPRAPALLAFKKWQTEEARRQRSSKKEIDK